MSRGGRRLAAAGCAASILTLSGCITQVAPGPNTDGLELAIESLRPLIEAECGWRFSCCEYGENTWTFGFAVLDEAECTEQVIATLSAGSAHEVVGTGPANRLLEVAYNFNEGRIAPRPEAIEACASILRARVCNAYVEPDPDGRCLPGEVELHDPCAIERLFEGLIPPGGECQPGADYSCAEGLCATSFAGGTCTKTAGFGEVCATDQGCNPGLYCDPIEGLCAVGAQLGQTCAYVDPTKPFPGTELIACAEGLECDPLRARCVATCSDGASCFGDQNCPQGLVCAVDRCRAPGDKGDPCNDASDCVSRRCDPISTVCLDLREVGELCTSHTDCESMWCDQATISCAEQLGNGEPCESGDSAQCKDGFCYFDPVAIPAGYECRSYQGPDEMCDNIELRCDPQADPFLVCTEESCQPYPFGLGVACTNDGECESGICFEELCDAGAPPGSECDDLSSTQPCRTELMCDRLDGSFQGTCTHRLRTGQTCEEDDQCWGQCTVRWSTRMCDNTLPSILEEAICDGGGLPPLPPIG